MIFYYAVYARIKTAKTRSKRFTIHSSSTTVVLQHLMLKSGLDVH